MMSCLRGIFSLAVNDELIRHDPTFGTFAEPKFKVGVEKHAYTKEQYEKVLSFALNYPGDLDIAVLLKTGISRSELLGLKTEDLLENKSLRIKQGTVVIADESGKRMIIREELKNKYRERIIPIDNELYRLLKNKPRTIEIKDGKRKKNITPEFLFHSPTGKAWDPDNWRRRVYEPVMAEMHAANPDIPILHAHELRHSFATYLVEYKGLSNFDVIKMLGWEG